MRFCNDMERTETQSFWRLGSPVGGQVEGEGES